MLSDDHPVGYETPAGDLVTLQGVARYQRDSRPGSDLSARATAGFTTIDESEVGSLTQAAEETTLRWAEAAYGSISGGRSPKIPDPVAREIVLKMGESIRRE